MQLIIRLFCICSVTAAAGALAPDASASPPKPVGKPAVPKAFPAPRPGRYQSEADHVRRYDMAISTVRATKLTAKQAEAIRKAFRAIDKNERGELTALRGTVERPTARKLIDWYALLRGRGTSQTYKSFLDENPAWPGRRQLVRHMERALLAENADAKSVVAAFAQSPPRSAAGDIALASALFALNNTDKAKALVTRSWRERNFTASTDTVFLERFSQYLTEQDHKWRIDRLLGDYVRWRSHRTSRISAVRRILPHLSKTEQKKLRARIAAFKGARAARKLLAKLPKDKTTDWGLAFQKVQAYRRARMYRQAEKILLKAPTDATTVPNLDGWWAERRMAMYAALRRKDLKGPYALIRAPGPLSANEANEQAFLAGWLALRHLKKPTAAEKHFLALEQSADGPLSRSRAAYWLGRTYEALARRDKAAAYYRKAAAIPDTFDSHLARLKLGPDVQKLQIKMPKAPTERQIEAFNSLDAVKAAVIAGKASLPPQVTRRFLNHFRYHFNTEAELAMAAHLAEALRDTQMAVRIGKSAIARGMNLIVYAYPVHAFPAYNPLRAPPETALLLSIARQESEFNTLIKSNAGARGLMQVMPITARHVCRDYKLKCSISRLTKDKSYNAMLASAYVGDRMKEFDGSYLLTVAGYNAGPSRARQWMKRFGDPRKANIDPIDWIHRIPFEETRAYVQKVLSNLQIYRARLSESDVTVRIDEDLSRTANTLRRPSTLRRASAAD